MNPEGRLFRYNAGVDSPRLMSALGARSGVLPDGRQVLGGPHPEGNYLGFEELPRISR